MLNSQHFHSDLHTEMQIYLFGKEDYLSPGKLSSENKLLLFRNLMIYLYTFTLEDLI